jgi:UTP--glucose-1-phosphate uridylyltransferase
MEVKFMKTRIRKVVFPVGGLGTRFLPVTRTLPKEMLPVVDTPLIQYAVDEARAAGIEEFIFVTGRGKSAIEDYFDRCFELESILSMRGKAKEMKTIDREVLRPGLAAFTRQQRPLGLGHAVWCARNLIGDEPFAVLLPDDLIMAEKPCLKQMVDIYEPIGGNLVAVMDVPPAAVGRYGVLCPGNNQGRLVEALGIVEKPSPDNAPSNLAVIGRYILEPRLFHHLQNLRPGSGGELQLTDGISRMAGESRVHGYRFAGRRFDCGDKIGYFEANVAFTLARKELADNARKVLARYGTTRARLQSSPVVPREPPGLDYAVGS